MERDLTDGIAYGSIRLIATAPPGATEWTVLHEDPAQPETVVFYLAVCQDCTPVLPQPFYDEGERDEWAGAHSLATGHDVARMTEVRYERRNGDE